MHFEAIKIRISATYDMNIVFRIINWSCINRCGKVVPKSKVVAAIKLVNTFDTEAIGYLMLILVPLILVIF